MFIRWKVRNRIGTTWQRPGKTFTAMLVECRRVRGPPRQRVVVYLGSIRQDLLEHDTHCLFRARFWDRVTAKLDQVALPFDTDKIEAAINRVVGRPTAEEIATDKVEVARRRAELRGQLSPRT